MRRAFLVVSICLAAPAAASAATLEPVGTYSTPLYVTSAPNDPDRIFVVERDGEIELTTGSGTSTFLDIKDLVLPGGERGLLSVAFPADFNQTGLFYVYYTSDPGGDLHIDEFRAAGDTADPATRRPVLQIPHPTNANHNGGQLQFGPDGYLYAATGDGGGGGDPQEAAQDLTSLLGKVLRVDPRATAGAAYSIPDSNPFAGTANDPIPGARDEIWSYGLRNPWRFSFDRATGALLIGDVGQAAWEEVDYVPEALGAGAGANFGWDCREGTHDFELAGCAGQVFTDPIFEYDITGANCAITGGYVVRDPALAGLVGRYLYADFCVGDLRSLVPALPLASDDRSEALTVSNPSTFGEDACGRLYVASLSGAVSRLVDQPSGPCLTRLLTVRTSGTGSGRVTGPGIDCPGDCLQRFFDGQRVQLAARPAGDSRFAGWSDACAGTAACALTLSSDATVTATFDDTTPGRLESRLTLKADDRRIRRGGEVELAVRASPCPGRAGDRVALVKNGRSNDAEQLNRRCRARFRKRPRRTAVFAAAIRADDAHAAAEAAPVRIRVRR